MKTFLPFLFILLLVGCSSKNMSPSTVTQEFWTAQKNKQIDRAKSLTIKEDTKKTTLYKKIKIRDVKFGEIIESKDYAKVPTTLYLKGDKNIDKVSFNTKLSKTDKGWRVNMTKTKQSLYIALSKLTAGSFGELLKDNLEGLGGVLGDIMKQFKESIEKGQQK